MIVLDASVLIAHLDGEDAHHEAANGLLVAADDEFGASAITLAEVFVTPARSGHLELVQTALEQLGVNELPFPVNTSVQLARLRAETGLKLPDCCVLLAAESTGATVATFDERLAAAAARRNLSVLSG